MNIWYIVAIIEVVGMLSLFINLAPKLPFLKMFNKDCLEYMIKGSIYVGLCVLGYFYLKPENQFYLNAWVCVMSALEAASNFKNAYQEYGKIKESDNDNSSIKDAILPCLAVVVFSLMIFFIFLHIFWKT